MATLHDTRALAPYHIFVNTSFTPLTGSGDAGVSNVSGSTAWAAIRHHSSSAAVPIPGVFALVPRETYARLISCHAFLQTSGTIEGTGSDGLFLPRSTLKLETVIPPGFPSTPGLPMYVKLIQTYTSGSNQGVVVKDHAHIGQPGPRDLSGSLEDKISLQLVFSRIR